VIHEGASDAALLGFPPRDIYEAAVFVVFDS